MSEQVQVRPAKHAFGYRVAVLSDVGRRRSENQDAYGYAVSSHAALYLVADGMGGARGGATASALAVNYILNQAFDPNCSIEPEGLRKAIAGSNSVIFSRSQEDPNLFGMGTTVASVLVTGDTVTMAHVGDSRIYFLSGDDFRQLTRDHTLVQELVDTGTIAENDAAAHPIAHMLTRSLGPTEIIGVEMKPFDRPLRGGERFLICSDGLYNHVTFDQIRAILKDGNPDTVVKALIKNALDGGGSDNVTAMVIEIAPSDAGDVLGIPSGSEIVRVASREAHGLPDEPVEDLSKWSAERASANGSGGDSHETTGFLKAQDLADYAAKHREARAEAAAAAQPAARKPNQPAILAVLIVGVIAGILLFGKGGGSSSGHHPSNGLPTPVPTSAPVTAGASTTNLDTGLPPEERTTEKPLELAAIEPPVAERSPSSEQSPVPVPELSAAPVESPVELATEAPVIEKTMEPGIMPPPLMTAPVVATAVPTIAPIEPITATPEASVAVPAETVSPMPVVQETAAPTPTVAATVVPSVQPPPAVSPGALVPSVSPVALRNPVELAVEATLSHGDAKLGEGIPADLVTKAFAMQVGEAPRLAGVDLEKIPELSANSPIVWEHESQRVARILVEDRARRVNGGAVIRDGKTQPKLFAADELQAAAQEKETVRRRVAELDGKISLLLVADRPEAKRKGKQTDAEIVRLKRAIQGKQQELAKWEQARASWKLVKDQSLSSDTVKLAEIAEKFSPAIHEALVAFRKASDAYTSSLSQWQNQPLDTQATSGLAQLGRDVKARRLELENNVRSEVNRGWLEADEQATRTRIELFGLEREKDLLVKFGGYVNGYVPLSGAARLGLYRKYLGERGKNIKRLRELQQTLDDEAEVALRIQQFSTGSGAGTL